MVYDAMADIVIILKRIKVQDTAVNLKTPKNNIKEKIFFEGVTQTVEVFPFLKNSICRMQSNIFWFAHQLRCLVDLLLIEGPL